MLSGALFSIYSCKDSYYIFYNFKKDTQMKKDEIDRLWDELGEDVIKELAARLKSTKSPVEMNELVKKNRIKNTLDLEDTLRHVHEHFAGLRYRFDDKMIRNAVLNKGGLEINCSEGYYKKSGSEATVLDLMRYINVTVVECGDKHYAQKYWGSVIIEITYERPNFNVNVDGTMECLKEVVSDCSCFDHEVVDDDKPCDVAYQEPCNDVDGADTTAYAKWVTVNNDDDEKYIKTKIFTTWQALDEWIEKVNKILAPISKVMAGISKEMPKILEMTRAENEKFQQLLKEHWTFECEVNKRLDKFKQILIATTEGIDIKEI